MLILVMQRRFSMLLLVLLRRFSMLTSAHKEKHGKSSENPLRIFHAFPRYQYGIDTTYLFYLIVTIEICFSN